MLIYNGIDKIIQKMLIYNGIDKIIHICHTFM